MNLIEQTAPPEHDQELDDFGLAHLWYNLCDHWRLFCVIATAFVIAAGLYGVFSKPVYKADALIQVQKQQATALGALADVAGALMTSSVVEGEVDVLTSRAIVNAAIAKSHVDTQISVDNYFPLLGSVYAHRHRLPPNTLARPLFGLSDYPWGGEQLELARFTVPEELYGKTFTLAIEPENRWRLTDAQDRVLATGRGAELAHFMATTDFGPKPGEIQVGHYLARPGTVFRIVRLSPNDAYESVVKSMKVAETTKDSSIIRVTYANGNPNVAAAMVNDIADAYVALNISNRSKQARMSLDYLKQKLPSIKAALDDSEQRLNEFRVRSNTIDVQQQTEALLTRAVELKRQRTNLELSREAYSKSYEPSHPVILGLASQIEALDHQLSQIETQVKALPPTQQNYLRLARDVTVNTQLYTSLLANAQQLEVAEAGTTGNVLLLDHASVPTKMAWPNLSIVALVGLVAGIFIAFVSVQFLATQRNLLQDTSQIERLSPIPLYATVPFSKAQRKLLQAPATAPTMLGQAKGNDPSIEALRSLRNALQFAASGKEHNVVLFTSPTPGVGKTFISTNFAYVLALSGRRILVIDADMRRPSFTSYMPADKGEASGGLAEVLAGAADPDQAIRRGVAENLDYLPAASHIPPNPAELLDHPRFTALIEQLKQQYDLVIIDSSPILPVSDALSIATVCDLVFVVSRANMTSEQQLRDTIARLNTAGVRVTGHVFNGFDVARHGYGYKHAYQHYNSMT